MRLHQDDQNKKCRYRLLLALLIGPLATIPAILVLFTFMLFFIPKLPTNLLDSYGLATMYGVFTLIASYAVTLIYGLPVYYLLKKLNLGFWGMLAVVSLMPACVVLLIGKNTWLAALVTAWVSLCVAFACWYLYEKACLIRAKN